jgi:sn-glycerol 3-phosphate transport system substrate-binding protein
LIAASIAASVTAGMPLASGCTSRSSDGRIEGALWFSYGGDNRTTLLALVERFHREQSRYRILPTYQGDYFEGLAKLRTSLAAGAPPAVTHVIGEVVPYLAEANVLETITSFGDIDTSDLVPALTQEGGFSKGASPRPLVCLPFNRSTPICYYNTAIFERLGLRAPTTWDELRDVARAATTPDRSVWGFECPIDWWFWLALIGQAGGELFGPAGEMLLGGEAGVRAIELWQRLVHEDRSMKPPPGRDYNAWQQANIDFSRGATAMIWTSTAFLASFKRQKALTFACAPLPKETRFSVPTGGTMFVMPKGAARASQEAAFAFLSWMMLPTQAEEWATKTGYIPISRRAIASLEARGYYDKSPADRVALDQLSAVTPWPWDARVFRVEREAVQPRLESAVLERKDARALLEEARQAALLP